jgi:hypothetical protein
MKMALIIDFDDEQHLIAKSRIEDLALGYAITTHKAQGSPAAWLSQSSEAVCSIGPCFTPR